MVTWSKHPWKSFSGLPCGNSHVSHDFWKSLFVVKLIFRLCKPILCIIQKGYNFCANGCPDWAENCCTMTPSNIERQPMYSSVIPIWRNFLSSKLLLKKMNSPRALELVLRSQVLSASWFCEAWLDPTRPRWHFRHDCISDLEKTLQSSLGKPSR